MLDMNNALVVAAHPDDEVLGVGGTIPLIKRYGGKATVLIVTDGSSAQYLNNKDVSDIKTTQLEESNRIMGTDRLIHWQMPDMRLDTIEHVELTRKLSEFIDDGVFDTVFFHAKNDVNLDHKLLYHAILVAVRPVPGQAVKKLLSYHVNSSTEWGGRSQDALFYPNYYIDISSTLETKLAAMETYKEELRDYPHPRSIKAIEYRAKVFGTECGYPAAEAFQIAFFREG